MSSSPQVDLEALKLLSLQSNNKSEYSLNNLGNSANMKELNDSTSDSMNEYTINLSTSDDFKSFQPTLLKDKMASRRQLLVSIKLKKSQIDPLSPGPVKGKSSSSKNIRTQLIYIYIYQ
jgi:hypothetical protein